MWSLPATVACTVLSWATLCSLASCAPTARPVGGEPAFAKSKGPPSSAPASDTAASGARGLYFAGRYEDALCEAERVLAAFPMISPVHCDAAAVAAYARARLGDWTEAFYTLSRVERACSEIDDTAAWEFLAREKNIGRLARSKEEEGWTRSRPTSVGLDAALIAEHERLCARTCADACIVVARGRIVSEYYSLFYEPPVGAMSTTKSVVSALVGILWDDKRITDLEMPVASYLPPSSPASSGGATVYHLLTHTSGISERSIPGFGAAWPPEFLYDMNSYVAGVAPTFPLGTFAYSNLGVQLLGPLLEARAGGSIADFARRRLFEPIGMFRSRLTLDGRGHAHLYDALSSTPTELARFGLLFARGGLWGETRIISEEWIAKSTSPSRTAAYYGLLWWLLDDLPGYAALGWMNNNVYVFPGHDVVIVRAQRSPRGPPEDLYQTRLMELLRRLLR